MSAVWGRTVVENANLTVQISTLRRVLDEGRLEGSCIQTVAARGYRFVRRSREWTSQPAWMSLPLSRTTTIVEWGLALSLFQTSRREPRHLPMCCKPGCGTFGYGADASPWSPSRSWSLSRACWPPHSGGLVRGLLPLPRRRRQRRRASIAERARLSIVVLPFADLSEGGGQQYFADGITDDLTTDLSRLTGMFVIARNTAFTSRTSR